MDIDAFDAIDNINNETPTITNTINSNETTTTTANVEAEITTYIILREQYVNRLKKALSRANAAQLQKRLLKSLDLLDMLRENENNAISNYNNLVNLDFETKTLQFFRAKHRFPSNFGPRTYPAPIWNGLGAPRCGPKTTTPKIRNFHVQH